MNRNALWNLVRTASMAGVATAGFALHGVASADGVVIKNVPLPVTGTVGITGPVNIQGAVGLAGTPTVNIGSMPPVTAAISDSAKTAFAPVYVLGSASATSGSPGSAGYMPLLNIPVGKRAVIESIGVNCTNSSGGSGPYVVEIVFPSCQVLTS